MTIYTGPVFEMACQQFAVIADHLEIPEDERSRILYPKRAIAVSCPIHRDDGTHDGLPGLSGSASPDAGAYEGRHAVLAQRDSVRWRRWPSG